MSDYTPDTTVIHACYLECTDWASYEGKSVSEVSNEQVAEFDRWLAEVKAEAVIELVARIEAAVILLGDDDITPTGRRMISKVLNPYRKGEEHV